MKKFINDIDDFLEESLRGFSQAHADIIKYHTQPGFIQRVSRTSIDKVTLISGGGSGHEPLHSGFVGKGMLDAACPGQIFTSPTPDQMVAAAEAVANEQGILWLVKNYAGDVMNFEMASEMVDIPSETILIDDDISLPKDHPTGRRGVAGTLIVEKIVGAGAEQGMDLTTCKALAEKVNQVTATMGVALHCCTVPAIGQPTFELSDKQIEMGVGIHGERGHKTMPFINAREIVEQIVTSINQELNPEKGQCVLLHVNGLGATPLIELYLIYQMAAQLWQSAGIKISRSLVGNYTTSLDMAGCSITLTLLDDDMIRLWDAPVHTASLRWGC